MWRVDDQLEHSNCGPPSQTLDQVIVSHVVESCGTSSLQMGFPQPSSSFSFFFLFFEKNSVQLCLSLAYSTRVMSLHLITASLHLPPEFGWGKVWQFAHDVLPFLWHLEQNVTEACVSSIYFIFLRGFCLAPFCMWVSCVVKESYILLYSGTFRCFLIRHLYITNLIYLNSEAHNVWVWCIFG